MADHHRRAGVSDGNEAVAYLAGTGPFSNREEHPLPCLVLLDLKMPGKGGLDVLKWLKGETALEGMPVIVLTSSNQESDIQRAYLLGANGFIIKPGDPSVLMQIVKSVQDYWLSEKRPPGTFTDYAAMQKIPFKTDVSAAA